MSNKNGSDPSDGNHEDFNDEFEDYVAWIEGDPAKEQLASRRRTERDRRQYEPDGPEPGECGRPRDQFDELEEAIEEERRQELRAGAKRLREEAFRLRERVPGPGTPPNGRAFTVVTADELDDWNPTEEEQAILDEAERVYRKADELEEEVTRLEEEEEKRILAEEAQRLVVDPDLAIKFVKGLLSRGLPYNLRRFVDALEAEEAEIDAEELEERRAEAAGGYKDLLSYCGTALAEPYISSHALEIYLPTATPQAKDELSRFLVELLIRGLPILLIRRELKLSGLDMVDPEQAERAQRKYRPELEVIHSRYGLSGLSTIWNVWNRSATPEDWTELERMEGEIGDAAAKVSPRPLTEIKKKRISWLLPGRLARSEITMLNGWPGAGKTSAIVDMVARLSRGEGLPGDPSVEPQRTLYLGTEDRDGTLRLRFEAAGADLDMIHIPVESEIDHLRLPSGEKEWMRYLRRYRIGVVVVDPLLGLIDSDLNAIQEQSMRIYMRSLRRAIEETGTAVFGIRHPNKASAGGNVLAIASASNSLALTAAARLELFIGSVPGDQDGLRAAATVKNNLSASAPTLGFRLRSVLVDIGDGGQPESVAAVEWAGTVDLSADDLMRRKGPRMAETSVDARAFLRGFLAGGPRTKKEVVAAAASSGISERTLQRARKEIVKSDGNPRGATWKLIDPDKFQLGDGPIEDPTPPDVDPTAPGPDPLVRDKPFTESGNSPTPGSESSEEEDRDV